MKKHRKLLQRLGSLAFVLSIYPLGVLIYTWICVFQSDLEGGKNGPLDAYRHTIASAVVSYSIGDWAVELMIVLMESKGEESNRMDIHNNRIGAQIGINSKSFGEIESSVRQFVSNGTVNANAPDQITWLPKKHWKGGWLW